MAAIGLSRYSGGGGGGVQVLQGADGETLRQGRMMRERRQLIDWGENLYQQVERLEQDRADLERQAADAQVELEQTRRRCAELERLVHEGVASGSVAGENSDLRKQLAAYAVEIDVLREEKAGVERALAAAQQNVQRLTVEREGFLQQVGDLSSSHTSLKQQCEKADSHRISESKLKAALESRLHEAQKELAATQESLKVEQDHHRWRQDELKHAQHLVHLKEERYDELLDAVNPLKDMLRSLQESYVRQTLEFERFIDNVKRKQADADQFLHSMFREVTAQGDSAYRMNLEMDRLRQDHHQSAGEFRMQAASSMSLEQQLAATRQQLAQAQQHLSQVAAMEPMYRSRVAADQAEIARLKEQLEARRRRQDGGPGPKWARRALERNISREMDLVQKGYNLEKVHEGAPKKREIRFCVISDQEMLMKWSKTPGRLTNTFTSLDLHDIIRLDYGNMSRPSVLHDDVFPWLCFSLYSTKRSYDFICPSEDVARAFVLVLSRLCHWASGVVTTRRQFEYMKGWCKLEEWCFRNKTSVAAEIIKKAGVSSRARRQSGLPGPGERPQPTGSGGVAVPAPLPPAGVT